MQDFADRKTLVIAGAIAGSILNAYEPMEELLARQLKRPGLLQGPGKQIMRVMKLTLLFIIAGLLQVKANVYSQQLTMDVRDESLIRVFAIIKKQTGYVYFGATELLAKAKPVTFKVKNEPLENVLKICFKDQPLDYTIDGKTISVFEKKKERGTSFSSGSPTPLLIDVRGRVTNEENDPVAGVSVLVKGTKTGTSTNGDGEFTLNKVPHDAVLVLTAVNIQPIEAAVNGQQNLNLKVKGKTGKLDEVQVIAYGKTSQRFNLGNVTTIKAEDIEKQPVQNPLLALQGRVPGLEVTQLTGMSGGNVRVRIQGRNSINAGLDPLIVIDGVPFPSQLTVSGLEDFVGLMGGSPLNYINPSDIESISILKDADATAIYGSRAANGAILITTKKGKIGKTELNINLQQGWGKVARKMDMLNTRQYLDMRYEAYRNDGIDWTRSNVTANDLKVWDTTRYTDWQKTLIGGTAQYTNISANISGGTPTVQYLIGGTYNRQTTVFPGNFDDQRGSVNMSIKGNSANQKFRVGVSAQYMYDKNRLPGVDLTSQAVLSHPNAPPLYNTDGTLNWALNAASRSTWDNPLSYTITDWNNITRNLVSNLQVAYTILPGLTIRSSVGYTNLQSDIYEPTVLEAYRPEIRSTEPRRARRGFRTMNTWIIEPQLEYNGRLGKGKIDGLLGTTAQQSTTDMLSLLGIGYSSDFLMKTLAAASTIQTIVDDKSMYRYSAFFGRLNYSWQDKYLLGLTARQDGSSRFGDKNKTHTFWSVAGGWIFSQEKWIQQHLHFLSFGKLRASYGTTGNDQIADYSYLALYDFYPQEIRYQNSPGLQINYFPNPRLQWEETRKRQWGIDLGFLHDRITLNASYSRNRSSNQLTGYTLPIMTGFSSIIANFPATIQNTSWEFLLSATPLQRNGLQWTSNINFTIPRNKLVSFPNIENTPYGNMFYGPKVGQPLGILVGLKYAGVDPQTGTYLVYDKNGNLTSKPGLGDYTILLNDRQELYGGWQNSFTYKGVQLDFLFQFVYQKGPREPYYSNGIIQPGRATRSEGNHPVTVLNRWQKPGDNTGIARFTTTTRSVLMLPRDSDAGHNYDISYIRLKNLSLSWQLPASWLSKSGFKYARLYLQGQNLATITKYNGLDPEISGYYLPPLQLWTAGVQAKL